MTSDNRTVLTFVIYAATLCIACAYGIFLTLPLFVSLVGGNEAVAGDILFAGAFGTLLSVGLCNQMLRFVRAHVLIALGALGYALGVGVFLATTGLSAALYVAGFFLGAGWGLTFTIGPIMLSSLVTDANRSVLFSILSAFNALGMGVAPVVAGSYVAGGGSYDVLFALALVLCIASAALFFGAGRRLAGAIPAPAAQRSYTERESLSAVFLSEARYPILMVFLGACIFSSMMNFQTTYATHLAMNFSIFYIAYTAGVIGARFLLSGFVGRQEPRAAMSVLLVGMCLALVMFIMLDGNQILYMTASALLGVTYGLVYPLIQAQAVNLTIPEHRSRVLVYFSMSYFLGVYGFPLLGGRIIVEGGYTVFLLVLLAIAVMELGVALYLLARRRRALLESKPT